MRAGSGASDYDSDNESFHSAHEDHARPPPLPPRRLNRDEEEDEDLKAEAVVIERFPPEEEAALLAQSNTAKSTANDLFKSFAYSDAISTYDRALASCPNYLEYEVAVLRNNIAACHIMLKDWKAAVNSATKALECLQRLDPVSERKKGDAGGVVEEVDDATAEKIENLEKSGHTRDEVQKLRIKAYLRRAKANCEIGGWGALAAADEDYKQLTTMPQLSKMDRQTVDRELKTLPIKLDGAKKKEMDDMMGKLKELGNGILKPFGFSTDNFQMTKDPKTGGYSMGFNQTGGAK